MTPHRIWFRPDGTNVQIKLKPFSLVVSAGFGALTGADAIFLSCAYGAGLGVASLSVSFRVSACSQGLMMTVGSFFLFPFCLVNIIEGVCNLVQKHQVWCTHAAKAFD